MVTTSKVYGGIASVKIIFEYLFKSFDLSHNLMTGIFEKRMGYSKSNSGDILARVENNVGQIGACCISILEKINTKSPIIRAVVVVPTHKAVLQTLEICIELGKQIDENISS